MSPSKDGPVDFEIVLRDLERVLQQNLGKGLEVKCFDTEDFTKAGDNYGSTLLKVRAIIKRNCDAHEEELNLVAKMLPPTKIQREIFESSFTFKKEIFIYEHLLPAYEKIYGKTFNVLPKFYGSRMSIKYDNEEVDEDVVILLENLKLKGYYMGDRHKGKYYLSWVIINYCMKKLCQI